MCRRNIVDITVSYLAIEGSLFSYIAVRVYALTKKNKLVPVVSGLIIIGQWIIAIYTMSQSSKGTTQVAALLSKRDFIPSLPALPETDAYDSEYSTLVAACADNVSPTNYF